MYKRDSEWSGNVKALNRALVAYALFAAISVATAISAVGDSTAQRPPQEVKPQLQPEKQTVLGLYVTAREAYERWKATAEKVKIIDVRTPEEFIFIDRGHGLEHPRRRPDIPMGRRREPFQDETASRFCVPGEEGGEARRYAPGYVPVRWPQRPCGQHAQPGRIQERL